MWGEEPPLRAAVTPSPSTTVVVQETQAAVFAEAKRSMESPIYRKISKAFANQIKMTFALAILWNYVHHGW